MSVTPAERKQKIRELNDAFRSSFKGGKVVLTSGIVALPIETHALVFSAVQTFTAFDKDNDPYGEHDFGGFQIKEETFFWKLDYYDKTMEHGSEDPSNPNITTRVLTIMLQCEY